MLKMNLIDLLDEHICNDQGAKKNIQLRQHP